MYNLKHFPGATRPALPARYFADAFDTGVTIRLSIPDLGLNEVYFSKPQSITYIIPSIVNEVSAIFVARMTFLAPGGVGINIFA